MANTQLVASVAVSGIIAPNLLLSLKKAYYNQIERHHLSTFSIDFHATGGSINGETCGEVS